MKNLSAEINKSLIESLKDKDQPAVDTLRMVKASIKNKEIELGRDLKEEETLKILRGEIKSRNDSISQFKKAGRDDLLQKEEKEVEIIKKFLPKDLDIKELEAIVKEAIKESAAGSVADLGKVMPLAVKKAKGKASGEDIKNLALKLLG